MLKDILTPKIAKIVNYAYGITGVLIGAVQVGFVAAAVAQPMFLTVALAVYAYFGIAVGLHAGANTPTEKAPETPPAAI